MWWREHNITRGGGCKGCGAFFRSGGGTEAGPTVFRLTYGVENGTICGMGARPCGAVQTLKNEGTVLQMGIIELILIAIGLSMDAFAVAICAGLTLQKVNAKNAVIIGLYFGGFQAGMPIIGYLAGTQFADRITAIDHWIAFVLLAFIGGKMIRDSLKKDDGDEGGIKAPSVRTMVPLALATSIDALAVGVSFAFLAVNIAAAATAIGVTTLAFSCGGVFIGKAAGLKFKNKAELIGGLILVAIGFKILLEHTVLS